MFVLMMGWDGGRPSEKAAWKTERAFGQKRKGRLKDRFQTAFRCGL
ncbi:hypothetical protein [Kingella potus]|nr:hypothetical protein [Kingella potus]UOP01372.1 hypothetical protein LVJ84_03830 [Kingella potus]